MFAALNPSAIAGVVLVAALACFVVGYLIRRGRRLQPSWLTVRDGRVVLNDKGRVKVGNRGLDISKIEASVAETFTVDEEGDVVLSEAGFEALKGEAGNDRAHP